MEETQTNKENAPDYPEETLSVTAAIEQLLGRLKEEKQHMDYIKPEMMPDIDLYMDQVTTFMDTHLESTKRYADDKILTKTMINNYAKNNLLPPPEKKKYSKDHLLLLTFIYYFKNMLSMNDIQCLLAPIKENYFHQADSGLTLEDVYREVFATVEGIQGDVIDDILAKYALSREKFSSPALDASSSADELHDFSFICMLCYDIFLKKQLVEKIIDKMAEASAENTGKKKHK